MWEADWIEEAEGLVRAEYVSHYENNDTLSSETAPSTDTDAATDFNDFGNLSVQSAARRHELDDYLHAPVEPVANPLR